MDEGTVEANKEAGAWGNPSPCWPRPWECVPPSRMSQRRNSPSPEPRSLVDRYLRLHGSGCGRQKRVTPLLPFRTPFHRLQRVSMPCVSERRPNEHTEAYHTRASLLLWHGASHADPTPPCLGAVASSERRPAASRSTPARPNPPRAKPPGPMSGPSRHPRPNLPAATAAESGGTMRGRRGRQRTAVKSSARPLPAPPRRAAFPGCCWRRSPHRAGDGSPE